MCGLRQAGPCNRLSSEQANQVQSRLIVDVAVGQSLSIVEQHPGVLQPLLIWENVCLGVDHGLCLLDNVAEQNLKPDRFPPLCVA